MMWESVQKSPTRARTQASELSWGMISVEPFLLHLHTSACFSDQICASNGGRSHIPTENTGGDYRATLFFPFTEPELAVEAVSEERIGSIGCSGNGRKDLYLVHFPIPSSVPVEESHSVRGAGPNMKGSMNIRKQLSPVQ